MSEMIYLPSDQVRVFPVAKERQTTNSEILNSRLLTEKNMSNLIRQLLGGTNGFVIDVVYPYTDSRLVRVKFNLSGYYFDIEFSGSGMAEGHHTVHASLLFDINSVNSTGEPQELAQDEKIDASAEGDSAYRYGGMYLIIDAEDEMLGSLHLFDFDSDGNGNIVMVEKNREDFFIFDINTLPIGGIDGRPKQS